MKKVKHDETSRHVGFGYSLFSVHAIPKSCSSEHVVQVKLGALCQTQTAARDMLFCDLCQVCLLSLFMATCLEDKGCQKCYPPLWTPCSQGISGYLLMLVTIWPLIHSIFSGIPSPKKRMGRDDEVSTVLLRWVT